MSTIQAEIEAYDARISELKSELQRVIADRSGALCRAWGITVGQTVRAVGGRYAGQLGKISDYSAPFSLTSRPWISVRLRNKDGSFGGRVVNWFSDWELADSADPAS